MRNCEASQPPDSADAVASGGNGAPRGRIGRAVVRALGFRRTRCGAVGSAPQPRWRLGFWLVVGIAVLPSDDRSLLAQEGSPSSSRTNLVEIALSGSVASGSRSFALIDGRLTFERLDSVYYEMAASVRGRYGRSNEELIAKNWGAEVSFDATPHEDVSPFAFADIERNPIRELLLRSRMGMGAKWVLARESSEHETSFSAALLTAYENHDDEDPPTSTWRLSLRLKKEFEIVTGIDLSTAWFLQPRLESPKDYLLDGVVEISQRLTEHVRLTFTFDYFRDSHPPADVPNSELRFLFGLNGRF